MILAIYIVLALLVVAGLAYVVVNYIPKKRHWIISLILLILIILLSCMIVKSIQKPIKFAKEKRAKYAQVIDNLKMIRDAEVAYNKVNGRYTADKNALVAFVDTGKFAVTKVETVIKTVSVGGGITVDKEERVETITGYTPVRADFAGRDYKNMFKVPGTNATFEIKVDSVEKVEGIHSSVFMARIDKETVLKQIEGDNDYLINEEKRALGGTEVKGEYISVGSLSDVKTNGNWPPIYDNKKDKK